MWIESALLLIPTLPCTVLAALAWSQRRRLVRASWRSLNIELAPPAPKVDEPDTT